MATNLEVFFCDLCNESVPAGDLDNGKAIRVKGRVIGGCCVRLVRPEPVVTERRTNTGFGALAALVVLAGVAGGAAFLDWRLSEETAVLGSRLVGFDERLGGTQDRLGKLEEVVAHAAARNDLTALSANLSGVDKALGAARDSLERRVARLEEVLTTLGEASQQRAAEQRETLSAVRAALSGITSDVAALRAVPHPAPKAAAPVAEAPPPEPVPPAVDGDLPPELKHHVLALADEDPGTRFAAVEKLLRARDVRTLAALLPMAKDANTFVRRLTVEGLRDFRRPESIDALLIALADPEPLVRHTAHTSLRALTTQKIEFDADGNASSRAAGQKRWQDWWEKNRATFAF